MANRLDGWRDLMDSIERSLDLYCEEISKEGELDESQSINERKRAFVNCMRKQIANPMPEMLLDMAVSRNYSTVSNREEEYLRRVQVLAKTDEPLGYDLARGFAELYNKHAITFSDSKKVNQIIEYSDRRFGISLELRANIIE
jgi:hypothetical protein